MKEILARLTRRGCLLLFDAGFYCFDLAWTLTQRDEHFIMKVNRNLKLVPIKGSVLGDGSFLARIHGKVDRCNRSPSASSIANCVGFARFA